MKASLLLSRISEREHIDPTRDEVDHEVERIARQQREPFAALRLKFEKDGTLGRIARHIQTEKTLNFLFEHARKVAAEDRVTGSTNQTAQPGDPLLNAGIQVIIVTKTGCNFPARRPPGATYPPEMTAVQEKMREANRIR